MCLCLSKCKKKARDYIYIRCVIVLLHVLCLFYYSSKCTYTHRNNTFYFAFVGFGRTVSGVLFEILPDSSNNRLLQEHLSLPLVLRSNNDDNDEHFLLLRRGLAQKKEGHPNMCVPRFHTNAENSQKHKPSHTDTRTHTQTHVQQQHHNTLLSFYFSIPYQPTRNCRGLSRMVKQCINVSIFVQEKGSLSQQSEPTRAHVAVDSGGSFVASVFCVIQLLRSTLLQEKEGDTHTIEKRLLTNAKKNKRTRNYCTSIGVRRIAARGTPH